MSLPSINCEIALEIFAALRQKLGNDDPDRLLTNQTFVAFAVSNKTVFNEFLTLFCKNLTIKFYDTYYILENAHIRLMFPYNCFPTVLGKFVNKLDISPLTVFMFKNLNMSLNMKDDFAEPESILKVFNAVYEQCDSLVLNQSALSDKFIFKIVKMCKRVKSLDVDIEVFRILIEDYFVTFSQLEVLELSRRPSQAIKCHTCPTPKVTTLKLTAHFTHDRMSVWSSVTLLPVWAIDTTLFPNVKSLQVDAFESTFDPEDMQNVASFLKRFPKLANANVTITLPDGRPLKAFGQPVHKAFKRTDFGVPINFTFKSNKMFGPSEKAELEKKGFKLQTGNCATRLRLQRRLGAGSSASEVRGEVDFPSPFLIKYNREAPLRGFAHHRLPSQRRRQFLQPLTASPLQMVYKIVLPNKTLQHFVAHKDEW